MTYVKPKLHFNNIFRKAQTGHDGTAYGTVAEAFQDPDSDFSVMGSLSLPADISAGSSLIGCGIEFDSTKNQYRITDYEQALRRLNSLIFRPGENLIKAMVVVGSYLYAACYVFPAVVVKVDLVTGLIEDYLMLNTGEDLALSIESSDDGLYLFVGCETSAGIIVKITVANFTRADSITLAAGEDDVYALASSGSYLYAGCGITPGKVVRINIADWAVEGSTITLAAGENIIRAIVVSGSYLYAGCQVGPAKLVRINLLSWAVDGATITFAAGENSIYSLATSGDYIYCGCATTPGKVVRVKISTWAIDGATITFAAGENTANALAINGDYLYCGCATTAGKVVRIKISTWAIDGATITFAAGENDIRTLAVYGDYLYSGCYLSPGKVVRIKISTWAIDGATVTFYIGENSTGAVVISGNYLYVGILPPAVPGGPGMIARVNLTTWAIEDDIITLAAGEEDIAALSVSNGFLYVACDLTPGPGKVVRINLSSWVVEGSTITLAAGEDRANSLSVSGSYLYVGCRVSPGKVVRINLATWAIDGATITFAAGENEIGVLNISGDYLYAGCITSPGKMVRIKLSTWAIDGATITFAAGETYVYAIAISGDYIYCGCYSSPGKIVRIKISTWAIDGATITFAVGENNATSLAIYSSYLYAGCSITPGKIIRISISNWAVDGDTITLNTGEGYPKLAISGVYLYAGCGNVPVKAVKIVLYDTFILFERLQTADIGGAFTIRQGITAVAEDATNPMTIYAADGHRTRRGKGAVNTLLKIRAHAPNFIQDGGFESGVFLPNWSAGANWAIDSTTELEGKYSAIYDLAASTHLQQTMTGKLEKDKTYRILFKAKSVGANPTAGAITVQAKQSTSNTDIDSDMTGTTPAITTTATWFTIDMTPEFETNDWYLKFLTDHTKANGASDIIIDEVYIYEKKIINTILIGYHNLVGKGSILVNAWKLPPIRSTASIAGGDGTEIGNFTVTTHNVLEQALTTSYDPIIELVIPATAAFQPEIGELYIGDYWQLPNFLQGPLDPYAENADGLHTMRFIVKNLPPALRTTTIKDLFLALRGNEAVWAKWNTDTPILMESPRSSREAPFTPYLTDLTIDLVERL